MNKNEIDKLKTEIEDKDIVIGCLKKELKRINAIFDAFEVEFDNIVTSYSEQIEETERANDRLFKVKNERDELLDVLKTVLPKANLSHYELNSICDIIEKIEGTEG